MRIAKVAVVPVRAHSQNLGSTRDCESCKAWKLTSISTEDRLLPSKQLPSLHYSLVELKFGDFLCILRLHAVVFQRTGPRLSFGSSTLHTEAGEALRETHKSLAVIALSACNAKASCTQLVVLTAHCSWTFQCSSFLGFVQFWDST